MPVLRLADLLSLFCKRSFECKDCIRLYWHKQRFADYRQRYAAAEI